MGRTSYCENQRDNCLADCTSGLMGDLAKGLGLRRAIANQARCAAGCQRDFRRCPLRQADPDADPAYDRSYPWWTDPGRTPMPPSLRQFDPAEIAGRIDMGELYAALADATGINPMWGGLSYIPPMIN